MGGSLHPEYWHMLCNPASPETARSVTPEIAEQVMKTLQEYDQTELQMVWLFRYGTPLDVFGNATDERYNRMHALRAFYCHE